MKISPDNPHLQKLTHLLIDESLGKRTPSENSRLQLGGDELLHEATRDFALLTDEERCVVIDWIVRSFIAQKKYTLLIEKLTSHK